MSVTIETLNLELSADANGYQRGLGDASASTDSFINGLNSKFGTVSTLLMGVGTLVAGAFAGIGIAAFDMAGDVNDATNSIQTQLGLTTDDARELSDVAVDIFGNNFGTSMDDATQSLITVRQQLKGIADDELQGVTEKALMVRDVFGIDIPESTNAANALMENFGLTSDQAFDFIVAGNQRGLNTSGDFLETISEYSTLFGSAGASADEFFSVLDSGLGTGVLGTDKAADAAKEFFIRIQDGSETTSAALQGLGINTEELFGKMKTGEATASDAFGLVMEKLNEIEDPLLRNQLGVALLGTQWEDLGPEAAAALTMTGTKMSDLEGATDSLNAKYNSLGAMFQGVWRKVQTEVLLPIGNKLLELANTIMPYVSSAIETIGAVLGGGDGLAGIIANLGSVFTNLLPSITAGLSTILNGMLEWVSSNVPNWMTALGQFAHGAIQWIADSLPGVVANLASLWQTLAGWVMTNAPAWASQLLDFGTKLVMWVLDALPGLIANLGQVFTDMLTWVIDSIPGWAGELLKLGEKLWQWIVDALPQIGSKLGDVLSALLTWVGNTIITIAPKLLELAGTFINWIAVDVLPVLPSKLLEIGSAILSFLGNILSEVGPKLLELATAFLDWIVNDVLPALPDKLAAIWDAIVTWIGDTAAKALDAAMAIGSAIAEGISGAISSGMSGLRNFVAGIINPIIGGINTVIDGLNLVNPLEDIPHIDYMADGGITAGGLTVMGERGLERVQGRGIDVLAGFGLYNVPSGLRVTPADQTASMVAGGGITIHIDARGAVDVGATEDAGYRGAQRALAEAGLSTLIRRQTKR